MNLSKNFKFCLSKSSRESITRFCISEFIFHYIRYLKTSQILTNSQRHYIFIQRIQSVSKYGLNQISARWIFHPRDSVAISENELKVPNQDSCFEISTCSVSYITVLLLIFKIKQFHIPSGFCNSFLSTSKCFPLYLIFAIFLFSLDLTFCLEY